MAVESIKIIWAYMLENGHITNGEWNHYGGCWDRPPGPGFNWKSIDATEKEFRKKVKKIGVNWSKTKEPTSSMESAFTDSFHPSDDVETLLGVIVLNDGSEYMIGVDNADHDFSSYIKMIANLAKDLTPSTIVK